MATQPTVREMQDVIMRLRRFAHEQDYDLCRPYLVTLVLACADVIETVLIARDWEPVIPEE